MSDNMLNILSNMDKLQGGKGVDLQENVKPVHNAESAILEALSRVQKEKALNENKDAEVEEQEEINECDDNLDECKDADADVVEEDPMNEAKLVEPEQEVGDVHLPSEAQVKEIDGADDVPENEHQHPHDGEEDNVEDEAVIKGAVNQCRACGAFHQLANCPVCGGDNHDFFGDVIDCDEAEGQDEFECEEIFVTMGNALGKVVMTNEATEKVIRGGELVKVKVRTKKKKLSSAQKAALAKARKKAHTAGADKARAKSMKIRAKKIGESVEQVVVTESAKPNVKLGVQLVSEEYGILEDLAEALGFNYSKLNKSYVRRIGECKLILDEAEGDLEGTVVYAKDRSGSYLSESVLHDLLEEAELDFEKAILEFQASEDSFVVAAYVNNMPVGTDEVMFDIAMDLGMKKLKSKIDMGLEEVYCESKAVAEDVAELLVDAAQGEIQGEKFHVEIQKDGKVIKVLKFKPGQM